MIITTLWFTQLLHIQLKWCCIIFMLPWLLVDGGLLRDAWLKELVSVAMEPRLCSDVLLTLALPIEEDLDLCLGPLFVDVFE